MDEHVWQHRVEAAVLAQDAEAMRRLYAQARTLFGDAADRRWAEVLSAYDATAVTG